MTGSAITLLILCVQSQVSEAILGERNCTFRGCATVSYCCATAAFPTTSEAQHKSAKFLSLQEASSNGTHEQEEKHHGNADSGAGGGNVGNFVCRCAQACGSDARCPPPPRSGARATQANAANSTARSRGLHPGMQQGELRAMNPESARLGANAREGQDEQAGAALQGTRIPQSAINRVLNRRGIK